jgi:hypothetical protein
MNGDSESKSDLKRAIDLTQERAINLFECSDDEMNTQVSMPKHVEKRKQYFSIIEHRMQSFLTA